MSESYLRSIESNIAKHQSSTESIQRGNRVQNGPSSRPMASNVIPVDPTIPPLRLTPQNSRFWSTNASSSKGNIIAVDSSPEIPGPQHTSYIPHPSNYAMQAYGTSSAATSRSGIYADPFLVSSLSRPMGKVRPAPQDAYEPPRKKQNVGRPGTGVILVEDSPEVSPRSRVWTAPSRTLNAPVLRSPLDEEDESPGPNRLRRGRAEDFDYYDAPPSPTPYSSNVQNPAFLRTSLSNAFPLATPDEVDRAIKLTKGNFVSASGILKVLAQRKDASDKVSISIAAQQEQERKAKEMAKQRKNKSAIYARRGPEQGSTQVESMKPRRNNDDSDSDGDDFKEDGFDSEGSDAEPRATDLELEALCTAEALNYFNTVPEENLVMMLACTPEQAGIITKMRPFASVDDVERKMVRKTGVTAKLFENYKDLMKGYRAVDAVLQRCERIGQDISSIQAVWEKCADDRPKLPQQQAVYLVDEPSGVPPLRLRSSDETAIMSSYIWDAPPTLADGVVLKEYQIMGLNWLNLLHSRGHSCILADEMGLGKTIQVIAFLTYLKESGAQDKFLIIVPASTLENWIREFTRFSPSVRVVSYYGTIPERAGLRKDFVENQDTWDVLITTYNFAQGGGNDHKFFKKITWSICVFDEGHVLKNYQSQRYHALMKIRAKWRVLLTGTPLQNNLQELLSLMNFILPRLFTDVVESFRAIFKVKASSQVGLLALDRVSRAKRMMTPFVLRRRKDQVLKELPKKTERIEWCEMTELQQEIYHQSWQRSRRVLLEESEEEDELAIAEAAGQKGRGKKKKQVKEQQQDLSSNVLMDLRKATSHPMLFRRLYDDEKIRIMARACLQEPEFQESKYDLVVEDMSVMTDAELHQFCKRYKSVRKYALDESRHTESGKVNALIRLLDGFFAEGRRVLIFSQFTQILDILKTVLDYKGWRYLTLTGSTAVDERQGLVDEFNEDDGYKVFLLSTKAGGMGINLTAASVVITFDQDFNPHNDLQASDRAYRIGQQRDVDVIKLIAKGTIEEDILQLARTKLQLDEAIAGDEEVSKQTENEVKKSLIDRIRKKLEQEENPEPQDTSMAPSQATVTDAVQRVDDLSIKSDPVFSDVLSALPAALLAATRPSSGTASPAGSLLRAEETPPVTQSPTPLPTPPEKIDGDSVIMVDE